MSWQGRTGLALVYGAVLLVPLAWVAVHAVDGDAGTVFERATEQADLAGELANSILLGLLTTVFAVAIGLPLAILLHTRAFPGRAALSSVAFLPLLIPPHIHTIAWTRIIGDKGWFTVWLQQTFDYTLKIRLPIGDPGTDALLGHLFPGPAWIMACAYFPLIVLAVGAGLRSLDRDGLEAARLLGGGRAALFRVVIPQIAPRLLAGAAFVFILALTTYPVVRLLDTPTLVHRVFGIMSQAHGNLAAASIVGLPLVGIAAVVIVGLGRIEATSGAQQKAGSGAATTRAGVGTLVIVLAILLLTSGLAIGSLVTVAGPLNLSGQGEPDHYQSVFPRVEKAFAESLLMTTTAVVALLLLSWPLGRALSRTRGVGGETAGLGALAFPPEVVGVAILLLWTEASAERVPAWFIGACAALIALPALLGRSLKRGGPAFLALAGCIFAFGMFLIESGVAESVQKTGYTMVIIAYLARFLPFTVRMFKAGFQALDQEEEDAARLCGHGLASRTVFVLAPRMGGVIASAAVMAYVLCFTELPATLHTIRPGWQSIQMRIFNMVHFQRIEEVCALCVLVVLMAALPVLVLHVLTHQKQEVL